MPSTPNQSESTLERLRSWLGYPFVTWVLNGPDEPPTKAQLEVAETLEARITTVVAEDPRLPATFALLPFMGVDEASGTTLLNVLRAHAGGDLRGPLDPTGDHLVDNLKLLACETYGELLLPRDTFGSLVGPHSSPQGQQLTAIVRGDPTFQFPEAAADPEPSIQVLRSTGLGGGLQPWAVGASLIQAAWDVARLDEEVPTLERVLAEVEPLVSQTRRVFGGRTSKVIGLASLTGVVLPDGATVDLGWGRLRATSPHHHPPGLEETHRSRRTIRRLEDGSEVAISDAGEVLLEVPVPYKIAIGSVDEAPDDWPPTFVSSEALHKRMTQVRLAHLLASAETEPPVLIPAWHRFVEPVVQGSGFGYSQLARYAHRTPTRLSHDDLTNWISWIKLLDRIRLSKLGVAPTRLLRASAERHDPYDALVDSVIAWEAMFAAGAEAVLRVSATMARLLQPAGTARPRTRRRIADLYDLRSKIVHGGEVDTSQVSQASRDAIRLTIDTMRVLIRDRPDLVAVSPAERSTSLLLE